MRAYLVVAAALLGTLGLDPQQKPETHPAPVILEVVMAAYTTAPYAAYFRAPDYVFRNGDLLVLRGRNFGPRTNRSLRLRLNQRIVDMSVAVWTDTVIRAHVPGAREFGVPLAGPTAQRRDVDGEIGVVDKTVPGWGVRRPVRVSFIWNWQLHGDWDGDGVKSRDIGGTDCDDRDRRRYPGAPEVPDTLGLDEDCDPQTIGERDADSDGYTDARVFNWVNGRVSKRGQDCDDLRTNVNPRSVEACNNRDDNCDGFIDEELLNCPTANQRVRPR